jgi:phosphate transport system protein
MPTIRQFENELGQIREQLLLMSSLTERNLSLAMKALVERDDNLASTVESEDSQIDHLEIAVDEMVITYMATHAPVARDCRFMLAASKISSNLERIGDQATTIARRTRELNKEPLLKPLIDIPMMADIASDMLRDGITCFIEQDVDNAISIIARDKSVDGIYKQLVRELTTYMIEDPKTITRSIHLMVIAKALESAADHAANIAEDIVYLYRAQDVRHDPAIKAGQS